jgi:hypothetical protein
MKKETIKCKNINNTTKMISIQTIAINSPTMDTMCDHSRLYASSDFFVMGQKNIGVCNELAWSITEKIMT